MDFELYKQEKQSALLMKNRIYEDIIIFNKMDSETKKNNEQLLRMLENKYGYFSAKYDKYDQLCREFLNEKQSEMLNASHVASSDAVQVNPSETVHSEEINQKIPEAEVVSEAKNNIEIAEHNSSKADKSSVKKKGFLSLFSRKKKIVQSTEPLDKTIENNKKIGEIPEEKVTEEQVSNKIEEVHVQESSLKRIDYYREQGFNAQQLEMISEGLEANMDVNLFAKKEYSAAQMRRILTCLEKGMDVTAILNPLLSLAQMDVLIMGMKNRDDISGFCNPEISAEEMAYRYVESKMKKDYSSERFSFEDFNHNQLTEIKRGVLRNLDVTPYFSPRFSAEQMKEIERGIEKGVDVSIYAYPENPPELMADYFFRLLAEQSKK